MAVCNPSILYLRDGNTPSHISAPMNTTCSHTGDVPGSPNELQVLLHTATTESHCLGLSQCRALREMGAGRFCWQQKCLQETVSGTKIQEVTGKNFKKPQNSQPRDQQKPWYQCTREMAWTHLCLCRYLTQTEFIWVFLTLQTQTDWKINEIPFDVQPVHLSSSQPC